MAVPRAPGVRNPLKISVMGFSLLVHYYLEIKFQRGYGGHVINFGNWRVAHDTVWELEGARNPARELEGAHDAGDSLVLNIENL